MRGYVAANGVHCIHMYACRFHCMHVYFVYLQQIECCLKPLINCASDPSNLPAFNSIFSQSDAILSLLPLTHGETPDLALHSKMLLALLNPLLDCEQLRALKLTRDEAGTCVSLLRKAVEHPYHLAEDFSLLTVLRALVWFTHEFSRQDKSSGKKPCSAYESKLVSVLQELRCNIELLVKEDVLSVVKAVLKLSGEEELLATAARLLWCLAHDTAAKAQILSDNEIVQALQEIEKHHSSPKLKLASHCALWLLGLQADGTCYFHIMHACYTFKVQLLLYPGSGVRASR